MWEGKELHVTLTTFFDQTVTDSLAIFNVTSKGQFQSRSSTFLLVIRVTPQQNINCVIIKGNKQWATASAA